MKRLLTIFCMGFFLAATAQTTKEVISIVGVGDVMLGTTYPVNFLPPADGRKLLSPVAAHLKNAQLTFGNYEGTLFNGEGVPKKCEDSTRCFAFKTPEQYVAHLRAAGFSVMSVANNHSGDFGEEGRNRTMEVSKNGGIAACGADKKPTAIVEKNGVKYGIAAFAPNVGTASINDYKTARRLVSYLDSVCDIVVVSFHGGGEGLAYQHVPRQKELFLGENRGDVYTFARVVIDAGADVVFGHGPHVARAVDLYKGRFIAYSLGNFATYGRFNLKGEAGLAPLVKVSVDRNGKFLKGMIIPIRQYGNGGPQLDKKRTVIRKIQQLTAQDFPDSSLVIHDNGAIKRKLKKKLKPQRS